MASPDLQAKANALNAKLEGEAKVAIDSIQKNSLRPIARDSYACVTSCYDKADKNTREEDIEICSRKCQIRYQTAAQILQQEINQFQNRLNRAMQQCNDDASAMITPDVHNDARKMKKVEDSVLACISKTVDNNIASLGPMKQRIESQLKNLPK